MAANYIVINSKFKPFSYEELVKPVQDATLAHQAYETQLAELSSRTDVWENMLNQEQDKELYSIYDNYSNSLKETSDQLAKNGLSPNIRQSLLDLRSRYSKDIIPIENAYNNKKTMMAQQAEARAKDNTALFDVDASQLSLSYFYNNPFASFNQISGKDLTARVSKAVSGLANELTAYGITGKIDPYTNAFMQRTGYTREQILDAINNPNSSERATILNSIVQSVIDSTGIQNWNNSEILDKAYDYANEGLWSAIGRSTITPMDNYGARLAAQMATRRSTNKEKDEDSKNNQFIRISIGNSGKQSEIVKRLDGLRNAGNNKVSTKVLDKAYLEMSKAKNEYDKFLSSLDEETKKQIDRYTTIKKSGIPTNVSSRISTSGLQALSVGTSSSTSNPTPPEYSKLSRLRDNYQKALGKFNEELQYIQDLEKKYSHLGSTNFEILSKAAALETLQQNQENTALPLNIKESDYNNVRKGVANVLGSLTEKELDSNNIGLRDSKGNTLDYDETAEILDPKNSDKIKFRISGGTDPKLQLIYDGKAYEFLSIPQITSFNKEMATVNNYLRDFSSNIISSITPISYEQLTSINTNGLANTPIKNINIERIDDNHIGTVLYNSDTGEYIKVLMDNNYNVLAQNSLSEEIEGEGKNRDSYFLNLATSGLKNLQPLFAEEYE